MQTVSRTNHMLTIEISSPNVKAVILSIRIADGITLSSSLSQ